MFAPAVPARLTELAITIATPKKITTNAGREILLISRKNRYIFLPSKMLWKILMVHGAPRGDSELRKSIGFNQENIENYSPL
jgi:hypothetical protein